jgi:hypothetical protein
VKSTVRLPRRKFVCGDVSDSISVSLLATVLWTRPDRLLQIQLIRPDHFHAVVRTDRFIRFIHLVLFFLLSRFHPALLTVTFMPSRRASLGSSPTSRIKSFMSPYFTNFLIHFLPTDHPLRSRRESAQRCSKRMLLSLGCGHAVPHM